MNVLILGSGGREHAVGWKIKQSELLNELYFAPGNAGTDELGVNLEVNVNDFQQIKEVVLSKSIDLVFVGPEDPLVNGIHDFFLSDDQLKSIPVIGPQKKGAWLEGSKEFCKEFMEKSGVPTAAYKAFTADTYDDGCLFLDTLKSPYVLKADGLAAGKGVLILDDLKEAKSELKEMLMNAKFGEASNKVVIEEFMHGIELSVFVLTDGDDYVILPEAKDYKRIGEGDTGLNTGGMGAITPVPFADAAFMERVEKEVVIPTIQGLKDQGIPYKGFLFIGLMNDNGNPRVVEYNVRLGDPETEVILPRLKTDLLFLFKAVGEGKLGECTVEFDDRSVCTVIMVSGGYPEAYDKGAVISGLKDTKGSMVFHAGTKLKDGKVVTNGGRVLAVSSYGKDFNEALEKSYSNTAVLNYEDKYFRSDLGFDLQKYL
jgi:phosphoribosylamine--glycine ligase